MLCEWLPSQSSSPLCFLLTPSSSFLLDLVSLHPSPKTQPLYFSKRLFQITPASSNPSSSNSPTTHRPHPDYLRTRHHCKTCVLVSAFISFLIRPRNFSAVHSLTSHANCGLFRRMNLTPYSKMFNLVKPSPTFYTVNVQHKDQASSKQARQSCQGRVASCSISRRQVAIL